MRSIGIYKIEAATKFITQLRQHLPGQLFELGMLNNQQEFINDMKKIIANNFNSLYNFKNWVKV